MTEELKPCPFCGMDAPDYWDEDNRGDTLLCWIQCRGCEATSEKTINKTKAIRAWNRRSIHGLTEREVLVAMAERTQLYDDYAAIRDYDRRQLPAAKPAQKQGEPK